ncbi:MAG: helix-turn-helix domain-containing protein [Candidatus Omnitrophica bacterium]|nr:helix-turn-helix domain-containing protein [Candidatus Omnitrophota bacterium]
MSDRLLTLQEAADYLNLTEEEVRELVSEGRIPAYQVGGMYLRFKEEHILALKAELLSDPAAGGVSAAQDKFRKAGHQNKTASRLKDFLYFNDFYIIAIGLILLLLYVIIKVIY